VAFAETGLISNAPCRKVHQPKRKSEISVGKISGGATDFAAQALGGSGAALAKAARFVQFRKAHPDLSPAKAKA
jgi:hypothetical protein